MIVFAFVAALLASPSWKLEAGPIPLAKAFELKKTLGDAAFGGEVDTAVGRLRDRAETAGRCATANETAAAARLELVRRSPDPQALARSQAAAEAALARRDALRAQYLAGAELPPPYGLVSRMAARAKADPDPRLAELYRRMAEDQFARIDSINLRRFFGPGVHTTWEKGLDDAALAYVDVIVNSGWCAQNIANAAWLKADLRAHGWYRISVYGADADRAAWSIVQHANHDLPFQEDVLSMLEPLWRSGETKGGNYAYLYDEIAAARGRPARFDVDGACTGAGIWALAPSTDRVAAEAWRAKAGLPPLSEYIAAKSRACPQTR